MRIHSWINSVLLVAAALASVAESRSSANCPKPTLPNGRVRIRGRGKMVNFRCRRKFERIGARFAICLPNGKWTQEAPICVSRGCPDLGELPDMIVKELHNGGMVKFECQPGMSRKGPEQLTCDGKQWSEKPPVCVAGASLQCDFESDTLCGWSQDGEDHFDWTWFSGSTPTTNTGPKFDHTLGEGNDGHYMFIEASSPRSNGHQAVLKSPLFQPDLGASCFQFWYHMWGPDSRGAVGRIEVFSKPSSAPLHMLSPLWSKEGNQGDKWQVAVVSIPEQDENFQIIIVGTRLLGYVSDLAIDDVILLNCSDVTTPKAEETTTTTPTTTTTTTIATTPTTRTTTTAMAPSTPLSSQPANTSAPPTPTSRRTTVMPSTTVPTTQAGARTTRRRTTTTTTPAPTRDTTPRTPPAPSTATTTTTMTTPTSTTTMPITSSPTTPTTPTTTTPTTTTPTTTTPTTTTMKKTTRVTTERTTPTRGTTRATTRKTSPSTTTPSVVTSTAAPRTPSTTLAALSTRGTTKGSPSTHPVTDVGTQTPTSAVTTTTTTATTTTSGQKETSAVSVSETPEVTAEVTTDGGSGEVPVVTDSPDTGDVVTQDYVNIPSHIPSSNATNATITDGVNSRPRKSDYLRLIIGLLAGIVAGVIIISILAALWMRNQKKKKQQEEEDEISMINSLEGNLFNHN